MINHGKYFYIILNICAYISISAAPFLSIKDRQGIPLKSVAWRQPFLIELALEGAQGLDEHSIPGLDQFDIINISSSLSSINGNGIAKYIYEVIAKKQGEMVVGPAEIMIQGTIQRSNTLTVIVSNQEEVCPQSGSQKQHQPRAFLQVEVKNCPYYVGQKIPVKLRFYFNTDFITLRSIVPSVSDEIKRTEAHELKGGSQEIAGAIYMYREWEWCFYISKPGTYVIPAYAADFTVKNNKRSGPWQAFSLWGHNSVGKRVYSNALNLEIIPLPVSNDVPQAIGSFSTYNLSLNKDTACVGDALTLTAQIMGDTDYESLPFPDIKDVPSSLKIYPSQQKVIQDSEGNSIGKQYEWVVQILKEGRITIPSQFFTYFDTDQARCHTLKSNSLVIEVTPGGFTHPSDFQDSNPEFNSHEIPDILEADVYRPALDESDLLYPMRTPSPIPLSIFLVLLLLGLLPALYRFLKTMILSRVLKRNRFATSSRFKHAYRTLAQLRKQPNPRALYELFATVVLGSVSETHSIDTYEMVLHAPLIAKMTELERQQWQIFCSTLVQYSFGPYQTIPQDFFDTAYRWLKRLHQLERE